MRLPFNIDGVEAKRLFSTAWLFKIASQRMLGLAKQLPVLPATDIGWKNTFRKMIYEAIPNRRYVDGVIVLVRGIYESCRQLGIDFKEVELGEWLMFQQVEKEYPVRNITLKQDHEFHITTIGYRGEAERITVKPTIPKNHRVLLDKIIEEKHAVRYAENSGRLHGGVDVNTDRISLAVVDGYGRLRDVKTFWFEDVTRRGYPVRKARTLIGMKIHDMLRYAYHHGVKALFLESPDVLGKLKLLWVRNGKRLHKNYNWKVSIFRSSIIEMIATKAPLYSIGISYVSPKGTTNSKEHDEAMKKYGLDRHTASAYLVALEVTTSH